MSRINNKLLILLVLQVLLVAWVFWPHSQPGFDEAQTSVTSIDPIAVDRLLISDPNKGVVLVRKDNGVDWHIPEYHGLPADGGRIQQILEQLPALSRGYPATTSTSAHDRFEVSSENFQRHVQYFGNEQKLAELYLGTSPGFRKVHLRVSQETPVYSVEFNSFDAPASAAEWLDTGLLQITEIDSIEGLDYRIHKQDQLWLSDYLQAAEPNAARDLITGLENLRVTTVVDIATASILADTPAPPSLVVEAARKRYEYHLYEIENARYLKRDDVAVFFSISQLDYDRLSNAGREQLFPTQEPTPEEKSEQ